MLSRLPIGRNEISSEKVINGNSTWLIKGYTEYIQNFHLI